MFVVQQQQQQQDPNLFCITTWELMPQLLKPGRQINQQMGSFKPFVDGVWGYKSVLCMLTMSPLRYSFAAAVLQWSCWHWWGIYQSLPGSF